MRTTSSILHCNINRTNASFQFHVSFLTANNLYTISWTWCIKSTNTT